MFSTNKYGDIYIFANDDRLGGGKIDVSCLSFAPPALDLGYINRDRYIKSVWNIFD